MKNFKECPRCKGEGWHHIAGGWKTCHVEPDQVVARLSQTISAEDARRMVGG